MGAKRTQTLAYEIVEQVAPWLEKGLKFPVIKIAIDNDKLNATREIVYKELKRKNLGGMITLSYENGWLYISPRRMNREQQLVSMIRKLMVSCDNERLYDEALELVKVE